MVNQIDDQVDQQVSEGHEESDTHHRSKVVVQQRLHHVATDTRPVEDVFNNDTPPQHEAVGQTHHSKKRNQRRFQGLEIVDVLLRHTVSPHAADVIFL